MKNIKIIIICLGMISFLACSSEDDIEKSSSCYDCNANLVVPLPVQYCDNEDGTADVTTLGITETVDLQGVSFEDFIVGIKAVTSCSKN